MAKNTNDLLDQLADNNCSIDDYLEENREDMIVLAAKDFWEAAIERSGMSKCNIINKADFNYCYFYDIVNGRKIASRDKVIRLILSMRLTTDDCQEALRISGRSALYPKVQRDALLIYGIENRYTVDVATVPGDALCYGRIRSDEQHRENGDQRPAPLYGTVPGRALHAGYYI